MQSTAVNLWCFNPAANNDKVYGLYLFNANGKFDVFSLFGRRGGSLQTHVWAEGVAMDEANRVYNQLLKDKSRKGYKLIKENVATLGMATPTLEIN